MSKRNSIAPSNTLLNYFTKTPPANKKIKAENGDPKKSAKLASPPNDENNSNNATGKKRERRSSPRGAGEGEEGAARRWKRLRLRPAADAYDSDADAAAEKPADEGAGAGDAGADDAGDAGAARAGRLQDSFGYEARRAPPPPPADPGSRADAGAGAGAEGEWVHLRLEFLRPEHIRDGARRRPAHPDYDPSTLYVPPAFLDQQTPAHRQWWELKAARFDCVLFFKVGKFYELYHMDAAVGVRELGFSYMKGEFAHSGFPESAYARMAAALAARGYKVARVEQTETPDMMHDRVRRCGGGKWERVVRREVCGVAARGLLAAGAREPAPACPLPEYSLALAHMPCSEEAGEEWWGACWADAATGELVLGAWADAAAAPRLLHALAARPPALVVVERGAAGARAAAVARAAAAGARLERRAFPAAARALDALAPRLRAPDGTWPPALRHFLRADGGGRVTAAEGRGELAVRALGALAALLADCLIDQQVLSMARVSRYVPPEDRAGGEAGAEGDEGAVVVVDAASLRSLRVLAGDGCLLQRLDRCVTPMGKRQLRAWVAAPGGGGAAGVRGRQAAVRALLQDAARAQRLRAALAALPDIDRLRARVHWLGSELALGAADARAVVYEERAEARRRVQALAALADALEAARALAAALGPSADAPLLARLALPPPAGAFPAYDDEVEYLRAAFDREAARAGELRVAPGVHADHDAAARAVDDARRALEDYRRDQERALAATLKFVGSDKKRYQLEAAAAARPPSDWRLEGARKGYKRYSTPRSRELVSALEGAEAAAGAAAGALGRRLCARLAAGGARWAAVSRAAAQLDALAALAEWARDQPPPLAMPDIDFSPKAEPFLEVEAGRHPCLGAEGYVCNGARLGAGRPPLLLLSGPNMGGKSTLMRQLALTALLAHLGSYVPAARCALSAVDRVFTRAGARDDILAGRSTFLRELEEAAAVCRRASARSLVLLDELGRGTSTHDGAGVAGGVVAWLAAAGCRALVATHYHALVAQLAAAPALRGRVALAHMACMVEAEDGAEGAEGGEESITFLYRVREGACPKSYGFHAARLAGVGAGVARRARRAAARLQAEAQAAAAFRALCRPAPPAPALTPAAARRALAALPPAALLPPRD